MKSISYLAVLVSMALSSGGAFGYYFKCESQDSDLHVRVQAHVHGEKGTKNAALLVVSDKGGTIFTATDVRYEEDGQALSGVMNKCEVDVDSLESTGSLAERIDAKKDKLLGRTIDSWATFHFKAPQFDTTATHKDGYEFEARFTAAVGNATESERLNCVFKQSAKRRNATK